MIKELKPCPACGTHAVFEVDEMKEKFYGACFSASCCMQGPYGRTKGQAAERWNALPRALEWTTEPPKEPGWYWVNPPYSDEYITFFSENDITSAFTLLDYDKYAFAGPIPMPKEAPCQPTTMK